MKRRGPKRKIGKELAVQVVGTTLENQCAFTNIFLKSWLFLKELAVQVVGTTLENQST